MVAVAPIAHRDVKRRNDAKRRRNAKHELRLAEEAPPIPSWDQELFDALVADSPIESLRARESLARAAVLLDLQIRAVRWSMEQGRATGEEHRAACAATSNLRRVLHELGVTRQAKAGDKEL